MATINKKKSIYNAKTYEGAKATIPNATEQLKRTIMACMLWEDNFYESGESVADRIEKLAMAVPEDKLNEIVIQAKYDQKIRHAPLLLAVGMARRGCLKADVLDKLIRRPDELAEFLALYWKDGKCPISAQVKKGLAKAFTKFDEYQLSKWNRDKEIKLKDVLFLCHAKPKDKEQEELWKRLIDNTLKTPDTWEVELSGSGDKKESWTRLITEKRLGAQAYLMNLRNMIDAGINKGIIVEGLTNLNFGKVLPFQFINAAKYNPNLEPDIEKHLLKVTDDMEKQGGKTIILVDVSGSMEDVISQKSKLGRLDVACGVAMIARDIYSDVEVYSFSERLVNIPLRRGFALRDAINNSQEHNGTYLGRALNEIYKLNPDRVIVITDEQSHDNVVIGNIKTYIINVGTYDRGIGYGNNSVHISGWSEKVLDYIREYEK